MSPEERSFRNLVEWHKDELKKILDGVLASELFSEYHHSRLVRNGILHRDPRINRTLPTPQAIKVLGWLKK